MRAATDKQMRYLGTLAQQIADRDSTPIEDVYVDLGIKDRTPWGLANRHLSAPQASAIIDLAKRDLAR